jgi:hypothetical protein
MAGSSLAALLQQRGSLAISLQHCSFFSLSVSQVSIAALQHCACSFADVSVNALSHSWARLQLAFRIHR